MHNLSFINKLNSSRVCTISSILQHPFNGLCWRPRVVALAGTVVTTEAQDQPQLDGKRRDCQTSMRWHVSKALLWDTTVICCLAESYVEAAAQGQPRNWWLVLHKTTKKADWARKRLLVPACCDGIIHYFGNNIRVSRSTHCRHFRW